MRNIETSTLLALLASFCLSTGAYILAQPDVVDDIPVQQIEFDDYEIKGRLPVVEMEEYEIIAQADEADDGDGENIDWMNDNWCLIHPDDVICQDSDDEDEVEGC